MHSFEHQARDKNSMAPKKGRVKGRGNAKGKGSYSSRNDGSGWNNWGGYDDYYSDGSGGKGKGQWCVIPTPRQSPVSWPGSLTEEMPSSVERSAGPGIRGGSWGIKRSVEFAIDDGGSDASGSKSKRCQSVRTLRFVPVLFLWYYFMVNSWYLMD